MKQPRSPGRPLSFDPDQALSQAVGLFWQRGYADASIQDLTDAMGINRPSLYAAFGDKEALFLKAVQAYRGQVQAQLEALFARALPLAPTLTALFEQAIDVYTQPRSAPRGCLLASAATAEAPQSAELRSAVREALLAIEATLRQGLTQCLRTPDARGRPPALDVEAAGLLAASFLYALSVRARLGVAERRLRADVPRLVAAVCRATPT